MSARLANGIVQRIANATTGLLDLTVPTLFGDSIVHSIPPMRITGLVTLPAEGAEVVVVRQGTLLRWLPLGLEFEADWVTVERHALVSPADDVLVGVDDADQGVYLGSAEATKGVGRVGDQVQVTIPAFTVVVDVVGGAPVKNPAPITLTGTITAGSAHVKAVD